jgi:hypothetical protein
VNVLTQNENSIFSSILIGMVEKRDLNAIEDGQNAVQMKKPKIQEGNDAAAPKRPALSLEALEKAKKALQLQKELKEKLKNLPQVTCQF